MKKTRVKEGEKYWYIITDLGTFTIDWLSDYRRYINEYHFMLGNYFHTKEEAESVAKKFRAVLKGAEVVNIPSEEETAAYLKERNIHPKSLEANSVMEGIEFVKSKIVK